MTGSPPHPAQVLKDKTLPDLGISVTEAANQLGVTRVALSRVLNGHTGISPEMALRLEAWLSKAERKDARHWLSLQLEYELWQARQRATVMPLNVQPARVSKPDA
ncbi:MAG: addiction module antidote protein, HigA family [Chitinophagaceae bacterium]|nr:MAG: addiction module antidote protein, HigA family [Chitinophagaceae bacterium]